MWRGVVEAARGVRRRPRPGEPGRLQASTRGVRPPARDGGPRVAEDGGDAVRGPRDATRPSDGAARRVAPGVPRYNPGKALTDDQKSFGPVEIPPAPIRASPTPPSLRISRSPRSTLLTTVGCRTAPPRGTVAYFARRRCPAVTGRGRALAVSPAPRRELELKEQSPSEDAGQAGLPCRLSSMALDARSGRCRSRRGGRWRVGLARGVRRDRHGLDDREGVAFEQHAV